MRDAIFTDSLSTINNFISNQTLSRPNLLVDVVELLQNINSQVTLIWIPSHVDTTENEQVDRLANIGSQRQRIDIDIGLEVHQAYCLTNNFINKL